MKILVLSDSHSVLFYARRFLDSIQPEAVIHLGDHFDDGQTLAESYPLIRFHQVPGNCDRWGMLRYEPNVKCYDVGGVRLYMTHGHVQKVKQTLSLLVKEARSMGAQAALYGHTHIPDCHREEDGLWVLNPGACGSPMGSVGLIETANGQITSVRILRKADLETEIAK